MRDDDPSRVSSAGGGGLPGPVAFGPFRLLLAERRLERDGKTVRIGGRALDILIALAAQPGRVVSKAQLSEAAWPGMVVEEANLRFHIGELRKVLDRDASGESLIATVAGRGYSLTARVDAHAPPADEDASSALVGREAEQAELGRLLNLAAAGEAQFAFVTGEAGVGKTALTARFARNAAAGGAAAAIGYCLPANADTDPYYPILDILMRLAGADGSEDLAALVSRVAPTWAIQLPTIAGETTAGDWQEILGATRHRMSRELCALLEIIAKQQLLILVIEDIQWADLATLDLLRAMANRHLKAKLLVAATLRYPGTAPAASSRAARLLCESLSVYQLATEIPLSPLTRGDVVEYLTRMTGQRPAPELSTRLHGRSGGNPLFMQTMVDYWLQNGLVTPNQDGWALTGEADVSELKAPPTLVRLIDAEIELLEPDRQRVVHAASVSEGVFSAAINHSATPLDKAAFEAVCEDLARTTGLIGRAEVQSLPDGRRVQGYAFRHAILCDVAYEHQSASRRAAAHAAVAAEIEKIYRYDLAPVASTLARHFLQAQDWVSAVKYLRLAARVALGRFSTREAAAALEQALAVARHCPLEARDEIEVEIKEELTPIEAGPFHPTAPELYAQLASDAGRVGRLDIQCRAILGQALVSTWSDLGRAVELFRKAIVLSQGLTDAPERARIAAYAHAWCSWVVGWDAEHAAGCEAAIEELRRLGDPIALNAGLVDWTRILFSSARYLEGYETIVASVEFLAASPRDNRVDLSLPYWQLRIGMPWCQLFAGNLGSAFEFFRSGVQSYLRNEDPVRAAIVQFFEALGCVLVQDFQNAAALVDNAVDFCAAGSSTVLTLNEKQMELAIRGVAALGEGDTVAAVHWLSLADQDAQHRRTVTTWYWGMVIGWGLTDACLAAGDLDAAREHAKAFHALAFSTRERTWRALACETAARIALAGGELSTAQAQIREGWTETDLGPLPLVAWRLHAVEAAVRAAAGDPDGAARHRQACADALTALAKTLPEGHTVRAALSSARPIFAPLYPVEPRSRGDPSIGPEQSRPREGERS
ncbi:MAG: hypothetical protein JWQ97_826 [Phenylobacterium sp.]|nr:hypothetical protein [Phenylobacterium sp.]